MCSRAAAVGTSTDPPPVSTHPRPRPPGRTEEPRMDDHPSPPSAKAGRYEEGACLTCGQFDYVTTELLRVGYRGERTLAAHDRLYPQVRQLIRELLEELRCELAELDPRLALTSIND